MKLTNQTRIYCCITVFFVLMLFACRKTDTTSNSPDPTPLTDTSDVSKLFERLQFFNPQKKDGAAPGAPTGSSLKKSFGDTLYLVDAMKIPVQFLHEDTTKNVAGVYVSFAGGSFYYVAPETEEKTESDTVSVVLVGFNTADLQLPVTFDVTLTPYGDDGQPIDQIIVPVKIEESNDDPNKPGLCGLTLPSGDYWNWTMSYIIDDVGDKGYIFMNHPSKIHGAGGQFIKGCCIDGISSYDINCASNTAAQRTLHFPTFFQMAEESFNFSPDGTYDRSSIQINANPNPPASDFCGNGEGVVELESDITLYVGNWTISRITVPSNLEFFYTTRNYLRLQGSGSSGGGFGNPGGILHYIDCRYLMMIQLDNEGGTRHLYKIYKRKGPGNPDWFPIS